MPYTVGNMTRKLIWHKFRQISESSGICLHYLTAELSLRPSKVSSSGSERYEIRLQSMTGIISSYSDVKRYVQSIQLWFEIEDDLKASVETTGVVLRPESSDDCRLPVPVMEAVPCRIPSSFFCIPGYGIAHCYTFFGLLSTQYALYVLSTRNMHSEENIP